MGIGISPFPSRRRAVVSSHGGSTLGWQPSVNNSLGQRRALSVCTCYHTRHSAISTCTCSTLAAALAVWHNETQLSESENSNG